MIIRTLGEFREKFASLPDDTPLSVWDEKMFLHGDANVTECEGDITFEFSYRPNEEPEKTDDYVKWRSDVDKKKGDKKKPRKLYVNLTPKHKHKSNKK